MIPLHIGVISASAETEEFTITIDSSILHGTVTADKATAEVGDPITLTVTPASGYRLKADTLKFNGTAISETTFAFAMPEEDVTVTAEFELIPTDTALVINLTSGGNPLPAWDTDASADFELIINRAKITNGQVPITIAVTGDNTGTVFPQTTATVTAAILSASAPAGSVTMVPLSGTFRTLTVTGAAVTTTSAVITVTATRTGLTQAEAKIRVTVISENISAVVSNTNIAGRENTAINPVIMTITLMDDKLTICDTCHEATCTKCKCTDCDKKPCECCKTSAPATCTHTVAHPQGTDCKGCTVAACADGTTKCSGSCTPCENICCATCYVALRCRDCLKFGKICICLNVNNWFGTDAAAGKTNLRGLDAKLTAVRTNNNIQIITIRITGIPTTTTPVANNGIVDIRSNLTIPANALVTSTAALAMTGTGTVRIKIAPPLPNNLTDIILWGDGMNLDIGLNLSKENLARQNLNNGSVADITDYTVVSYQNRNTPARWTAVRENRPFISDILPKILNSRIVDLQIANAEVDMERGANRGRPKIGANIITFRGTIEKRPRFGESTPGKRYVVNYSPQANFNRDTWTLTERGANISLYKAADASSVDFGLFENLMISVEITAENRKNPEWNKFLSFENTAGFTIAPPAEPGGNHTITAAGAIPSANPANPLFIRPMPESGRQERMQYMIKEDARITSGGVYVPSSRPMRIRIMGNSKAPTLRTELNRLGNLTSRKGIELVNSTDGANPSTVASTTVGNAVFHDITTIGSTLRVSLTEREIVLNPLAGGGARTAEITVNVAVRFAATERRPASAQQILTGVKWTPPPAAAE
jgi:hypothetical protein